MTQTCPDLILIHKKIDPHTPTEEFFLKSKKKSRQIKRVFQLRVIRAFRSTLEDMEEKRSVHSMRSTRSYLARPMSDISYVDEDTLSPTSGHGMVLADGSNRRHRQNNSCKGMKSGSQRDSNSGHFGGGINAQTQEQNSSVISTNNSNNQHQYLKVEGTSYRVHRGGGGGSNTAGNPKREQLHSRQHSAQSADAQTQSAESSFAVDDAPGPPLPCVQIVSSSPSPQPAGSVQPTPQPAMPPRVASPSLLIATASPGPQPGSIPAAGQPAGPAPGTAVTVQTTGGALQTHLLPSPIYGFGYDPSYCQYLGQGVDGYQYELVRRPSIGPPVELLVPQAPADVGGMHQRRASGHGIPYLTPNSMQASFESTTGPPPSSTPIFIQQQQPLSPRHLHHNPQQVAPQAPPQQQVAPHSPLHRPSSDSAWGVTTTTSSSGPTGPPNTNNDIPKLIHETSI